MGHPGSSDYPDSVDAAYGTGAARVNGVSIVDDDDYNFPDIQIRQLQTYYGTTGQLLGSGVPNKGFGGVVSPIADGGNAFDIAAHDTFTSGTLLRVGDTYASFVPKFTIADDGSIWSNAGLQLQSSAVVTDILDDDTMAADRDDALATQQSIKAYVDSLAGGGAPVSSIQLGSAYTYTQAAVPVEEVVGNGSFNGNLVGSLTAYFKASVTNVWASTGVGETTRVRLYDIGPAAGPPDVSPRLVVELTFTAQGGPRASEQALTVVSSSPGTNDILDSDRMYEVVIIQSISTTGDVGYIGSAGIEVR